MSIIVLVRFQLNSKCDCKYSFLGSEIEFQFRRIFQITCSSHFNQWPKWKSCSSSSKTITWVWFFYLIRKRVYDDNEFLFLNELFFFLIWRKSNITIYHEDRGVELSSRRKKKEYHILLDLISFLQILDIYICIYLEFSFIFCFYCCLCHGEFFQSLLTECIKFSITSSDINFDIVLINVSSLFCNIVIYFVIVREIDFVKRVCDYHVAFSIYITCDCYVAYTSKVLLFGIDIIMIFTSSLTNHYSSWYCIDLALALDIVIAMDRNFFILYLRLWRSKSFC